MVPSLIDGKTEALRNSREVTQMAHLLLEKIPPGWHLH